MLGILDSVLLRKNLKMAVETICVHVKRIAGAKLTLEVAPDILIKDLKVKLAQELGEEDAATERQRLIFQGKVMKDDQRLSDFRVADGHTVHLVMRPADAPAGAPPDIPDTTSNTASNAAAAANPSMVYHTLPNGGGLGVMMMTMADSLGGFTNNIINGMNQSNPGISTVIPPPTEGTASPAGATNTAGATSTAATGTNTQPGNSNGSAGAASGAPAPQNIHTNANAIIANAQQMVQRMFQQHQQDAAQIHQQAINTARQQQNAAAHSARQQQQHSTAQSFHQQHSNSQQRPGSHPAASASAPSTEFGSLLTGLSGTPPFTNARDPSVALAQFQARLSVINASLAQFNALAAGSSSTQSAAQQSWLQSRSSDLATAVTQLGHQCHLVSHTIRTMGNPMRATQSSTATTVHFTHPQTTTTSALAPQTRSTTTTVHSTQPETSTTTTTTTRTTTNNSTTENNTPAASADTDGHTGAEAEVMSDVDVEIEDVDFENFEDLYD